MPFVQQPPQYMVATNPFYLGNPNLSGIGCAAAESHLPGDDEPMNQPVVWYSRWKQATSWQLFIRFLFHWSEKKTCFNNPAWRELVLWSRISLDIRSQPKGWSVTSVKKPWEQATVCRNNLNLMEVVSKKLDENGGVYIYIHMYIHTLTIIICNIKSYNYTCI